MLPAADRAQASWNYLQPDCAAGAGGARVSYDMNRLQRLDTATRYLVTLNDDDQLIAEDLVIARMVYEHPIFTPASVAAQARLPELNDGVLAFAGAYHGWGFHEDGCRSGVEAAAQPGRASGDRPGTLDGRATTVAGPITPARYDVRISHRRRDPVDYGFSQRSTSWLIDLDEVPSLPRGLRWLCRFASQRPPRRPVRQPAGQPGPVPGRARGRPAVDGS